MDPYSLIGLAAARAVAAFTVRQFDPQAGKNIAIAASAVLLLALLAHITGAARSISELASAGGIPAGTVLVSLKAVGIAYLTKLASALCRDLGESSLAACCELTGRLMLLELALPLIVKIAGMLAELVNTGI